MMKKLISSLMTFCMLFVMSAPVLAASDVNTDNKGESEYSDSLLDKADAKLTAEEVFQTAVSSIDATDCAKFTFAQPLYNFADNPVAFMFYLNPEGYIIADDKGRVLEYNLEGDHLFFIDANDHYYYGGIASYMKKDGSQIIDLISGDLINSNTTSRKNSNVVQDYSSDDFWKQDSIELSSSLQASESVGNATAAAAATQFSLNYSTRMYNCNNKNNWTYFGFSDSDGVCGSTALAIMTAYLDDYHKDSTHDWCEDSKKTADSSSSYKYGRQLVKEIIGYIEPTGSGSLLLGPYTFYLQDHDIWDRQMVVALTENGSWNSAKNSIQRDYPCVVGVSAGFNGVYYKDYESHFMTVVGVSTTSSGTKYYHVNCGWGSTGTDHNGYDKLNANGKNIGRVFYLENC